MTEINIIAFDVPFPANYGGVIDVFYKIKYFHHKGIKVHLHCFEYGKGQQSELNKYCETVTYYPRKTGFLPHLSSLPYIVKSRTSKHLKTHLLKNDFPIIFEGLHSCFLLSDPVFTERLKIVRNHNIEHHYYNGLASIETSILKKKYFKEEARKLKRFEPILKNADICLAISETDCAYFKKKYPKTKTLFIPGFHANETTTINPGKGDYVLYHGNLSVIENVNAAKFIIERLFKDLNLPLKMAGLKPSKELIRLIKDYPTIELIQNPTDEEMNVLIRNAQINLLYTEQATGLKLKLLNVLYQGRHCIVNPKMVEGTSLGKLCFIEQNSTDLKQIIRSTFELEMSQDEIDSRAFLLDREYSNESSFQKIIDTVQ